MDERPDAEPGNVECNARPGVDAVAAPAAAMPADLARVVESWPDLPPAIRAGVLALVDAAGAG